MNTNDDLSHDTTPLDASLRLQLRGLRRELAPERDLWPGIAARIAAALTLPAVDVMVTCLRLGATECQRNHPGREVHPVKRGCLPLALPLGRVRAGGVQRRSLRAVRVRR